MGGSGSGRKPGPKRLVKEIIPISEIFEEEEVRMYHDFVDIYMKDFEQDDLSAGDTDDIMDLAKNRILEFRLLKTTKQDSVSHIDIAATLERIRKENKILKENLASRRRDRINPNEFKGFSIVDLAVAFDEEKKNKLAEQIRNNRKEEKEASEAREDYVGNRYDVEKTVKDEEDEY